MRDIRFRGKRTDNGEWVEGSLLTETHDIAGNIEKRCKISDITYGQDDEGFAIYMSGVEEYVDQSTVGEWTGLTDKNGVKIFEGDVVRFKRTDALGWTRERVGQVLYYDTLPIFYVLSTTGDAWDWCVCEDIEVIGNIYDNPDLIER